MKREKFLHRPVISSFDILGKITGGQLVLTPVVSHALTTDPFAGARVVGTIATLLVDLDLAFHLSHSLGLARKIGAIGFEPTASRSRTERTTRLCYAPMNLMLFSTDIGGSLDLLRIFSNRDQGAPTTRQFMLGTAKRRGL